MNGVARVHNLVLTPPAWPTPWLRRLDHGDVLRTGKVVGRAAETDPGHGRWSGGHLVTPLTGGCRAAQGVVGGLLDAPGAAGAEWPDDFGRLELERFSIAQYDDTDEARAAGLSAEHATLYEHASVWPPQEPALRAAPHRYHAAFADVARRVLGS